MRSTRSAQGLCALLFLVGVVYSNAQSEAQLEVEEGAPLQLECVLRPEQAADWRLNGSRLPAVLLQGAAQREELAQGGVLSRLALGPAVPHHAGRYTCAHASDAPATTVRVLPRPSARAPRPGAADTTEAPAPPTPAASDAHSDNFIKLTYDVGRTFNLKCELPRAPNARVVWSKNGTEVAAGGHYKFVEDGTVLGIDGRSTEDDYGDYACSVGGASMAWRVSGNAHPKLPANSNVVEGQKLKLVCKLSGKPYPDVHWLFFNESMNGTGAAEALGARVSINSSENGVSGAELVLEDARSSDAGQLMCVAGAANATTTVRVKDMYAALWPFLGICAEVFVLCAIILVYEKRRTKPELDDSDTDNHDQKKS